MNKRDIISIIDKTNLDQYRLEIIKNLLEEDLSSNMIKSIYNTLNKNHTIVEKFINILSKKNNIHNNGITQIEKTLYNYSNEITNNTIDNLINHKIDSNEITTYTFKDLKYIEFKSYLNENIIEDLYDIKWSGIGKGEILLCMLLKNAISNTYKRGDIIINDDIIEVKSNNSRLINQSDFGSGEEVSNFWINSIKYHPKIKKKDLLDDHDNNLKWNLSRSNNYLNHYVNILISKRVSLTEISEIICSGWDKLFKYDKIDRSSIKSILRKYKTLDGDAFKYYTFEIFLHNMKYYLSTSKIDKIAITSEYGFYLFDKSFFHQDKEKLRIFSKQHLLYKYPSLTNTASNGRVFSISLL